FRDNFELMRREPNSHFGTIFEPDQELKWHLYPEVKAAELESKLAAARRHSLRPDALSGFWTAANRTFALSLVPNPSKVAWEFRAGMSVAEYEAALAEQQRLGRRPLAVSSEQDGDRILYTAVWIDYSPQKK